MGQLASKYRVCVELKLRVCRLRIISQCFRALDLGLYLGGGGVGGYMQGIAMELKDWNFRARGLYNIHPKDESSLELINLKPPTPKIFLSFTSDNHTQVWILHWTLISNIYTLSRYALSQQVYVPRLPCVQAQTRQNIIFPQICND